MTSGESPPIGGEVVAHEEAGLRIRLDDGRPGLLPRSAGPNLAIGYRGTFRVEGEEPSGGLVLSIAVGASEPRRHTFDQEFNRLQDALANHGPHSLRQPAAADDALGRERIERWMANVDEAMGRLKKRRAKRLNH